MLTEAICCWCSADPSAGWPQPSLSSRSTPILLVKYSLSCILGILQGQICNVWNARLVSLGCHVCRGIDEAYGQRDRGQCFGRDASLSPMPRPMAGPREHEPQIRRYAAEQGLREGRPSPPGGWYGAAEPGPSIQERDWSDRMPAGEQRLRRPSMGLAPSRLDAAHDSTTPEPNLDRGRRSQVIIDCHD